MDLDGAALLANDPFVGAGIDGGQVSLPAGPGTRRQAAMTERFALVALPLPLATPTPTAFPRPWATESPRGRASWFPSVDGS